MYQYYDGQVTQSLKLVLVLRVKLSDILFLSLCSLDSTGPEIITCYGLREIGSLICILFTHRRQLNAIFFIQFHVTITSNNFGPSTGSNKTLGTILCDPIVPSSVGQVGLSGYSAFSVPNQLGQKQLVC